MRLRKTKKTTATLSQIVDGYSNSEISGYSCNYLNDNITTVDKNPTVDNTKIYFNNPDKNSSGMHHYKLISFFTTTGSGSDSINLSLYTGSDPILKRFAAISILTNESYSGLQRTDSNLCGRVIGNYQAYLILDITTYMDPNELKYYVGTTMQIDQGGQYASTFNGQFSFNTLDYLGIQLSTLAISNYRGAVLVREF